MQFSDNPILATDAYKQTHWMQYPSGTEFVYSYLESRKDDPTVFFGLQYFLQHIEGSIVTTAHVDEAEAFCRKVFGAEYFNRLGWLRIVNEHGGRLPLRIKAPPEGMVIPGRNVLVTMENTDPTCPFITNFMETWMLQVWYPITVATRSYRIRKVIDEYARRTGCEVGPFHLNDFGFRGVSSRESAGIGGMAHLVMFDGTDNLEGIRYAMNTYEASVCGHSVMAAEHSTVTAYGEGNETQAYAAIMEACPSDALLSIVADSYDIHHAVRHIFGNRLKSRILDRLGTVVIRPDSGPPSLMCAEVLAGLWGSFGGTTNPHGYRTLDPHVKVICGDGIDEDSIRRILDAITAPGLRFSTDNIVFGMGGALLQQVHRDTHAFAFKCSATCRDGVWHDVYKTTSSDPSKASKRGKLALVEPGATVKSPHEDDLLTTVFEDGEVRVRHHFDDVRRRAREN